MTSAAPADKDVRDTSEEIQELEQQSDTGEANNAPTANASATLHRHDQDKEDPATVAASEELKHTYISDKIENSSGTGSKSTNHGSAEDKEMGGPVKASTPDPEVSEEQEDDLRERLSSPKKKRGRDQDDEVKGAGDVKEDESGNVSDADALNGAKLEPDRKRPRDLTQASGAAEEITPVKDLSTDLSNTDKTSSSSEKASDTKVTFGSALTKQPQTSSSAFASSGFGALAGSSTSPFGALGASQPSVFGGSLQSTGGFGGLNNGKSQNSTSSSASASDKPSVGFGSAFGGGSTSGFGAIGAKPGGSVFGNAFGNGFAAAGGPKLSSFAAPSKDSPPASTKPVKAFGAPESDEEEDEEDEGSEAGAASDDEESSKAGGEEKKKTKLSKIQVDDGEAGEVTMFQVRAKLYILDSKEVGWKERGVGTVKINVPKPCAEFDENGAPIPGSFDASGLEGEDESYSGPRVPRLIMRQENTHRVILNTIIFRAMEFKDKASSSGTQIMFTAFEGDKPSNVLLKMNEANARAFKSEIDSIKHEL